MSKYSLVFLVLCSFLFSFSPVYSEKKIEFGTKGETLERLSTVLKEATVLPQIRFTAKEYRNSKVEVLSKLRNEGWFEKPLIVRSSARAEDSANESLAGHFTSILNVYGQENIEKAVEEVLSSFDKREGEDQILIQPMLRQVKISGVAFSKHPSSGAPYILINYDDQSGSTTSVTAGATNDLKAYCHYRNTKLLPPAPLDRVIRLLLEVESLVETDSLDIEFAIDSEQKIYLLQARPLIVTQNSSIPKELHTETVQQIHDKIKKASSPHPYLHGSKTIYAVMPDWNPAEIIGIRPRPLAFSLYKEIITDKIWASMRHYYGYRDLEGFPLLINFHGLPYVDVRASFNSLLPATVEDPLAEKLINYYLNRLKEFPHLHDKVEFEILYTCYTFDLQERLEPLRNHGFSKEELDAFTGHLRNLTNQILDPQNGVWRLDFEKIALLEKKYEIIRKSNLDPISKIVWLLEDCKKYGTLPFAGLARSGFIAVQLLKSLVKMGVLNLEEYNAFLQSLDTVSSQMTIDLGKLKKEEFLAIYGHLRPGTYDIRSPRYDEDPDGYFNWNSVERLKKPPPFRLSLKQMQQTEELLKSHGINLSAINFLAFIKAAIEGREYSKFIFSKNLSLAISLIKEIGACYGLTPEECSYLDIALIKQLHSSSQPIEEAIRKGIEEGKKNYVISEQLILPQLIHSPEQIFSFLLPINQPNYITLKRALGAVAKHTDEKHLLKGAILMIPSADPGFDWIFSHEIAGFITMYGGMNSHMAIRAGELAIPAVIGAGEVLYREWEKASTLELDCANHKVRVINSFKPNQK